MSTSWKGQDSVFVFIKVAWVRISAIQKKALTHYEMARPRSSRARMDHMVRKELTNGGQQVCSLMFYFPDSRNRSSFPLQLLIA
jgi:hypothetical protein